MLRKTFISLAIIGAVVILYLSFNLPNNPYEMIPSILYFNHYRPLWFCDFVGITGLYIIMLCTLYEKIKKIV